MIKNHKLNCINLVYGWSVKIYPNGNRFEEESSNLFFKTGQIIRATLDGENIGKLFAPASVLFFSKNEILNNFDPAFRRLEDIY